MVDNARSVRAEPGQVTLSYIVMCDVQSGRPWVLEATL